MTNIANKEERVWCIALSEDSSKELVKELAEAKSMLEKRIRELENELKLYRLLTKLLDEALSKLSFVPASQLIRPKRAEEVIEEEPVSRYPILSPDNEHIADVSIFKDKIIVKMNVKFRKEVPPFKSFFVGRILRKFAEEDRQKVSLGEISPNEVFSYEIKEDSEGYVEGLIIRNYKSEEVLRELKRALKWTLRRVRR